MNSIEFLELRQIFFLLFEKYINACHISFTIRPSMKVFLQFLWREKDNKRGKG